MRLVTEATVDHPESWTPEQASRVAAVFDELAGGWDERFGAGGHVEPLLDALDRGGVTASEVSTVVEVGSGTGAATVVLAQRFRRVLAVDLSFEMLRRSPPSTGLRLQADGAQLPVPDGFADAVVLLNAFLFPAEVDRVLAPAGAVVWVSSIGARTPIHLPPDRVAAALPGAWDGVASEAGAGSWCVLRRRTSTG